MGMFTILPQSECIKTQAEAEAALEYLRRDQIRTVHRDGTWFLGCDTETTGLSRPKDRAIILALSTRNRRFAIFPSAIMYFAEFLEDPEVMLVMWNANFDTWMLKNIGIDVYRKCKKLQYRVIDAMVMHALLSDIASHSLKSVAQELLGVKMTPFKTVFGINASTKVPLSEILLDPENELVATDYASLDAYTTLMAFYKLRELLKEMACGDGTMWDYFMEYEFKFTRILYEMEKTGITVSEKVLMEMGPELEEDAMEHRKWLIKFSGRPDLNPGSLADMRKVFFDQLGYEPPSYTASGRPQITESALERWSQKGEGCQVATHLLALRRLEKQLSTYVVSLVDKMHHHSLIHATFVQIGARTGRLSSRDPNLQNQPPFIRKAYVPRPGHKLFAADYGQLEMRILAHFSKDPTLCTAIREGLDVHSATVETMFGIPYDQVQIAKKLSDEKEHERVYPPGWGKERVDEVIKKRAAAKAIGFGLMYGQGARALAEKVGMSIDEARATIRLYFNKMPGIKRYFTRAIDKAKEDGYCTTIAGRRRQLPGLNSYFSDAVAAAERQVKNSPIQGTAAFITMMAMISVYESEMLEESGAKLLIQVHDELVFDIPEEHMHEGSPVLEEIKKLMRNAVKLEVPLEVSSNSGDNWKEAK